MKRIRFLRACAALLALSLAGCAQGAAPPEQEQQAASPGRYVERDGTLPDGIGTVMDLREQEDGALLLLANSDRSSPRGPWRLYSSADGGDTWAGRDNACLSQLGGEAMVMAARLGRQGEAALLLFESGPRDGENVPQDGENVPQDGESGPWGYRLLTAARDGSVQRDEAFTLTGTNLISTGLAQASNGDWLVETWHGLFWLDGESLAVRQTFFDGPEDLYLEYSYASAGESLYLAQGEEIAVYSLATGEMENRLEAGALDHGFYGSGAMYSSGKERLLLAQPDGKRLFYCDQNGLFARAAEGTMPEQILDASVTSLNLPTRKPFRLAMGDDGAFYALFEEGEGYHLARWSYTGEPAPEKTVMKLYALRDFQDGALRQAIGYYQIQHPDVQILYTVGVQSGENTGASESDALRTLSTELMAGNGPDVLVLDDLPVGSLANKGALMELTGRAERGAEQGELVSSVVLGMRREDGKIYGIPTAFRIPAMLGDPQAVNSIHNFQELAQWLMASAREQPQTRPMERTGSAFVDEMFYPLTRRSWFQDGAVDERALAAHLETVKALGELPYSDDIDFRNDLDAGAWFQGTIAMAVGTLDSVYDLDVITSLLALGEKEGKLALLPGDEAGYYVPNKVVGLNASGAQRERAAEFLDLLLSENVQQNEYYAGLPVNRRVLERQLRSTGTMYANRTLVVEGLGGLRMEIDSHWPDEAAEKLFWTLVDSLRWPAGGDAEIDGFYYDAAMGFYMGGELEPAIASLKAALELKSAE